MGSRNIFVYLKLCCRPAHCSSSFLNAADIFCSSASSDASSGKGSKASKCSKASKKSLDEDCEDPALGDAQTETLSGDFSGASATNVITFSDTLVEGTDVDVIVTKADTTDDVYTVDQDTDRRRLVDVSSYSCPPAGGVLVDFAGSLSATIAINLDTDTAIVVCSSADDVIGVYEIKFVPADTPAPTTTPKPSMAPVTAAPVAPTEAPVTPTDAPVTPTDAPVGPTEAPVTPTDAPVTPTDAPVTPTDAPVTPTDAPVTPTDAPVMPTDAPVMPTDAPVMPTDAPMM